MKSRISIQEVTGHVSAVLKGILFTGISIQIVMGIVWVCCNFFHVPQYGESLFYMQVSRTLRCDEYTGILYPLLLWIVRRNHYVVYGIQLAAAFMAAWRFLSVSLSGTKWKIIWGSAAFMTIPVAMQCHMAMLPCSFAASLLLLELSLVAEALKEAKERTLRKLAGISLCWLALALLLPEYFWLGAVPVVMFGIACCRRRGYGKSWYYGFLLVAVFMGMILGINSLTQTQGYYGRLRKTPLMTLTQRVSWTSLLKEYDSWIQQMPAQINRETVLEAAMYADGMDRYFFPAMEQAVADQVITAQQAEKNYLTLIEMAWEQHDSVIIKEVIWDMLGYGASPAFLQVFLEGRGYDTYSSRNYDFFLENTPRLSKLYMDYGCWWFVVTAVLTAALQVLRLSGSRPEGRKATAETVLCCLIMAGVMILWYTMQGAGMQDYKNTVLIDQLWMAWPVLLLGQRGKQSSPESGV